MKKVNLICLIVIVALIVLLSGGYLLLNIVNNNKITTILTMDINPSIEISLNKKGRVVKMVSLNDDGKKLLNDTEYKGLSLKESLSSLKEELIEKKYINEDDENIILINIKGENIENEIKEIYEKDSNIKIQFQEINEKSKENANKYNISESKSSFIEEIITSNPDLNLTFEELKDKSINSIDEYIKEKEQIIADEEITSEPVVPAEPVNPPVQNPNDDGGARYGSFAKCDGLESAITNDDAFRKTLEELGLEYDKYRYNAQTIASIYNEICSYETILILNKTKYIVYHNFVDNSFVHKDSYPYLAGTWEDVREIVNNYFATTYGANPEEVEPVSASGGTMDDKNYEFQAKYKDKDYDFLVVKETGQILSVN